MTSIETLCRLQAVDHEWGEKGHLYQALKDTLSNQAELTARREEHQHNTASLAAERTALRDAELELASVTAKVRAVDKSLYDEGGTLSPRELEAMRQNSEHLKRRIDQLETQVLGSMARVEELDAQVTREGRDLQAFEAAWAREHDAQTTQYAALRARLQELRAERERLRADLATTELALYDELRAKKGGLALAPLKEGVCQVCHVTIPWHKARSVSQSSAIITCEGCGRILYQG
ncbi:MAG: hypothetical protein GX557_14715 [Chloroflexi bacterium]|nr:hypothetical protein [Chloroflexota bacterium]